MKRILDFFVAPVPCPSGCAVTITAAMWAMVLCSAAHAETYRATDIGTLSRVGRSTPTAISATGKVVGYGDLRTGATHAFLANGKGIRDLGTLPSPIELPYSLAYGVNAKTEVVGYSITSAFIWDAQRGMRALCEGTAYQVNDLGTVAGICEGIGFIWTRSIGQQYLEPPAGRQWYNARFGINRTGQVIGNTSDPTVGSPRAVLWEASTGAQLLDIPAGTVWSSAEAISNAGQVAGYASVGPPEDGLTFHAVVWDSPHEMEDLGDLPGGFDNSTAYGMNDVGQIVGSSSAEADGLNHGFVWTRAEGMQDLNDLIDRAHPRSAHLLIQEAYAINDKGQIAVLASDDRGSVFVLPAYVLIPSK